jgi:hypothetical protein
VLGAGALAAVTLGTGTSGAAAEAAGVGVGNGAGTLGVGVAAGAVGDPDASGRGEGDGAGAEADAPGAEEPEGTVLELVAPATDGEAAAPPPGAAVGAPVGTPVGATGGTGRPCPETAVLPAGGACVVLTPAVVEDDEGRGERGAAGSGSRPPGLSGCPIKLNASNTT